MNRAGKPNSGARLTETLWPTGAHEAELSHLDAQRARVQALLQMTAEARAAGKSLAELDADPAYRALLGVA